MGTKSSRAPSFLIPLLKWDSQITAQLAVCATKNSPCSQYRPQMKWLEISCNGLIWIPAPIAFLWMFRGNESVCVNLVFALMIDIVIVATLKALTRRRRPSVNETDEAIPSVSVDKFSFPSGHATRAMLITLLVWSSECCIIFKLLFLAWGVSVTCSRVLLGRHHVLDILAGVFISFVQYFIVSCVWISEDMAGYIALALLGYRSNDANYEADL